MSDLDACAVRHDGTLKDASEIQWVHSPTSDNITFPTLNADNIFDDMNFDDANLDDAQAFPSPKGLTGKESARRVAGKRVPKPSGKVSASGAQNLSPRTKKFFFSRFEGIFFT